MATAALSPGDIASPIRSILSDFPRVHVRLGEVEGVELTRKRVQLADGEVGYDYLILATGVRHSYFGHDEWEPAAPGLKSLDDALEMRRRILLAFEAAETEADPAAQAALLTFVVVGGGPTGVELAGSIAEIARHTLARDFRRIDPQAARVVLLEAGPRILPTFSEELSASAVASLKRLGVEVRTGAPVTLVSRSEVRIGEQVLPTRTTLWAAGVVGSPLGRSLGVPLDRVGRVIVEPDCSVPGHPEVFVLGDLASFSHQTGKPLSGLAPVAIQMGKATAHNIWRSLKGEPRVPFRYQDRGTMATIGRAAGIAETGSLRLHGFLGWMAWLFVHLLFLIGFRNRLVVMVQWVWQYLTYKRGARLITGWKARLPRSGPRA